MTRFNLSLAILACSVATSSIATAAGVRYSLTPLDPSLTPSAQITDLNDRGEVVGTDGTGRAFLWNGQLVDPGSVLDPARRVSSARGINDRSDIIGNFTDGQGRLRGYLLSRGEVIAIQVIADRGAFPQAINNRRQVVGTRPLPALSGSLGSMLAFDINNRGQVVGFSSMPDGSSRATLWQGDRAIDLNDRIAADDPLRPFVSLRGAFQINDRRQIVAFGPDSRVADGEFRFYLLTPVQ